MDDLADEIGLFGGSAEEGGAVVWWMDFVETICAVSLRAMHVCVGAHAVKGATIKWGAGGAVPAHGAC